MAAAAALKRGRHDPDLCDAASAATATTSVRVRCEWCGQYGFGSLNVDRFELELIEPALAESLDRIALAKNHASCLYSYACSLVPHTRADLRLLMRDRIRGVASLEHGQPTFTPAYDDAADASD